MVLTWGNARNNDKRSCASWSRRCATSTNTSRGSWKWTRTRWTNTSRISTKRMLMCWRTWMGRGFSGMNWRDETATATCFTSASYRTWVTRRCSPSAAGRSMKKRRFSPYSTSTSSSRTPNRSSLWSSRLPSSRNSLGSYTSRPTRRCMSERPSKTSRDSDRTKSTSSRSRRCRWCTRPTRPSTKRSRKDSGFASSRGCTKATWGASLISTRARPRSRSS